MSRKWKASWPDYKMLVVADEDGVARYYPFVADSKHAGERFRIAGNMFVVRSDNSIHLPQKFMEEYGFLRPDGRRALILEAYGKYYPVKYKGRGYVGEEWRKINQWLEEFAPVDPVKGKRYVQGAKIWYGKSIEEYYSGLNGGVLSIKQCDYEDLVFVEALRKPKTKEGCKIMFDKYGHAYWYHPQLLTKYEEANHT